MKLIMLHQCGANRSLSAQGIRAQVGIPTKQEIYNAGRQRGKDSQPERQPTSTPTRVRGSSRGAQRVEVALSGRR